MFSPSVSAMLVLTPQGGTPALPVPSSLGSARSEEKQAPDLRVPTLHSVLNCVFRL